MTNIRSLFITLNLNDKLSASLKRAERMADQTKSRMDLVSKSTQNTEQAMAAFATMMAIADKIQKDVTRVASIQNAQLRRLADTYVKLKWKVEEYSHAVRRSMQRAGAFLKSHAEDLRNVGLAASAAIGGVMWRLEKYESAMAKIRALTRDNREEYEYFLNVMNRFGRTGLFSKSDIANMLAYAKANRITREELEQLLPYVQSGAAIYGEDLTTALMAMVRAMKYGEAELAERMGLQLRENAVMEESMKLYGKRLSQLTAEQKQRVIMLAIQNQYVDIVGKENEIMGENIVKLRQARNALDDAAVTIGSYLLPPIAKVATAFSKLVKWLDDRPILGAAVAYGLLGTAMVGIGGYAAVKLASALKWVRDLTVWNTIAQSRFATVLTARVIPAIGRAAIAFRGLAITMLTNPITLAIMGIVGSVLLLQHAWVHNWFNIRDKTLAVINAIRGGIDWLVGRIKWAIEMLQKLFAFTPVGLGITTAKTITSSIPRIIPSSSSINMGGVKANVVVNLDNVRLDSLDRVKRLGIEIARHQEEIQRRVLYRQTLARG